MRRSLAALILLGAGLALSDVYFRNGGTRLGPVTNIACGSGLTCSRDAGIGVIDAAGTTSFWYDGGAGYITSTETPIVIGNGGAYQEGMNDVPHAYVMRANDNTREFPNFVWQRSDLVPLADIQYQGGNGTSVKSGMNLRTSSNGDVNISLGSTNANGGINFVLARFATGSASTGGLSMYTASANSAIILETTGARIKMSAAGTNDYWYSNGTNIKTPGPVSVGSFTTAGLPAAGTVGAGSLAYDTTLTVPTYSTGSAWVPLAAAPAASSCDAGTYATAISGAGVLTCSTPPDTIYTHPTVSWSACTFKDNNGVDTPWQNYDATTYNACAQFTDADGRCHVRGMVKPTAETDGGLIITTLDGACVPARTNIFSVMTSGNVLGRLDVDTSGQSLITTSTSWVSLDGITLDSAANP